MRKFFTTGCALAIFITAGAAVSFAQKAATEKKPAETASATTAGSVTASPAYAELLLKRTELQSQLESLILEYTEDFPKVKEIRHSLGLIGRDSLRMGKVKPSDQSKLTLALGKLMVRKIELETELWTLRQGYQDDHPDVKRAKKKVEIYESAIAEILN